MPVKAVLFDLDGTLVDSIPDVLIAVNSTLTAFGRTVLDRAQIMTMIGEGARVMMHKAFSASGSAVDDAALDPAIAFYQRRYREAPMLRSRLYPGVIETLDMLRDAGWLLGVCTNKPDGLAEIVLKDAGIRDRFGALVGGDTPLRKPHPQHVLETLLRLNADHRHAVMVGDSEHDIGAARAADVVSVAVSWGYSRDAASDMGADFLIDRMDALPDIVSRISARPAE